MCGFLVEYSFGDNELTAPDSFQKLLLLSKHRGPDSSIIEREAHYQLGFNRLSILDISDRGNQPKRSPTGRYHMTFNGEIYNYKELSETYQLENLQSTSDTEVVLHLLDKIGFEKTLIILRGMYALSVVDTHLDVLYLARDYIGIKPLFYGISSNGIVASSQFNQVFKHQWFSSSLELRAEIMKEYFGFGFMQAPNTVFKQIFQVNPGAFLKINRQGEVDVNNFKSFDFFNNQSFLDEETFKKEALLNIKLSVKQQLVSDVSLSTFLSGGIDSPLVTAIANQEKGNIEAFTMSVSDSEIDESVEAKAYAEHLELDHTIETIQSKDILAAIDTHFQFLSEPFGDYSSIPTYLISKKASKNHKVMLSGDGGDELFYGYPRMLDVLNKRYWFILPHAIRKYIVRIGNKLNLIKTWAPHDCDTFEAFLMGKHLNIYKKKLDEIFPKINFSDELNQIYSFESTYSRSKTLNWMRKNEMKSHLQRILIKTDRMSMANSLEVRVPLLDYFIVEQALRYTPKRFRSEKDLKSLLKSMMSNYYPKNTIQCKKKGFEVPMKKWLRNDLKDDVKNTIFHQQFYGAEKLDITTLKTHVNDFYEEKHTKFWGIWHVYAWQKWALANDLI